ncbi:MAG: serine/threonine-protein kinase [Planctomycetota bacterium]|nr:serine/threonine-protein kinase [Planctomycetota bacterium]
MFDDSHPDPEPTPAEERRVLRLLEELSADAAGGGLRSLEHYLEANPGHESLVERETLAFAAGRAAPAAAQRLGPYSLEDVLGRGAQGIVYLALDERLGRRVALKQLIGLAVAGTGLPALVAREVEALSRLEHPGIAGVLEAGVHDGVAFVATRLVEGPTLERALADWRAGEPPPLAERLELAQDLARALGAAHAAGVVHRDVKPSNVILGVDGTPVLIDFGLAKALDGELPVRTRTGDLIGTPRYMSPERLAGRGADDPRGDVWALGVLLFELCTLKPPFDGPTVESIARRIEREEPASVRGQLGRGSLVSRDLDSILAVALEKDVDRRYADAGELAQDLDRLRHKQPILARPPGRIGRGLRWLRRHPALAVILLLLATIAMGSGATSWHLGRVLERERAANIGVLAGRARADAGSARLMLEGDEPGRYLAAREQLATVGASLRELDAAGASITSSLFPDSVGLRRDAALALTTLDLRELPSAPLGGLGIVRAAPGGRVLGSFTVDPGSRNLGLRLVTAAGESLPELDLSGLPRFLDLLAVGPAGERVVMASGGRAWLVDAGSAEPLVSGEVGEGEAALDLGELLAAEFSGDGGQVLLHGRGGWAVLGADTGEVQACGPAPDGRASSGGFSPDGTWVGLAVDGGVRLQGLRDQGAIELDLDGELIAVRPLGVRLGAEVPDALVARRTDVGFELVQYADGELHTLLSEVAPAAPLPALAVDATGELGAAVLAGRIWILDLRRREVLHQSSLASMSATDSLVLSLSDAGELELLVCQRSSMPRRFELVPGLRLLEDADTRPAETPLLLGSRALPPGSGLLPESVVHFLDDPDLLLEPGTEGLLMRVVFSGALSGSAPGLARPRAVAWLRVLTESSVQGIVSVWESGTPEPLLTVEVSAVSVGGGLALDEAGETLAIFNPGGHLRLFDVASGEELLALDLPVVEVSSLGFVEGGDLLLEGGSGGPRRVHIARLVQAIGGLGLDR